MKLEQLLLLEQLGQLLTDHSSLSLLLMQLERLLKMEQLLLLEQFEQLLSSLLLLLTQLERLLIVDLVYLM